MGFFKDLRDDISQAVNELLPEDDFFGIEGESAEGNDLLHLEKEKEQTGVDGGSFDRTAEIPFDKDEPSFHETEGENLASENVQEDILAALAHLGEDIGEESDFGTIPAESVEKENKEEVLKDAGMEEVAKEETKAELATEEVSAGENNPMIDMDPFQEKLNEFTQMDSIAPQETESESLGDLGIELTETEFPGTEENAPISKELQESIKVDLTNKESEDAFGENLLNGIDLFSEEELLKEESELDLLEKGFSEEEVHLDFLETDLLDGDALDTDVLSEEATMDLLEVDLLKEEPKVDSFEGDLLEKESKVDSFEGDLLEEESKVDSFEEDLWKEDSKVESLEEDRKEEPKAEFPQEDLLEEEPMANLSEEDALLEKEPKEGLLEEELLEEPKIASLEKELVEDKLSMEQSESHSDEESTPNDSVKMQGQEIVESIEGLHQEPVFDEVQGTLLTNVQSLETIEEENSVEMLKEDMEDVSTTGDLEAFVRQQEEVILPDGKKADVLEPMIEENITEKGEKIMESNLENVQATDQVTVITKGTVINGSISSDGGLEVNGTITGDVECLGKLTINGNVSGHLKAAEVVVSTPRLDGGIDSEGDVKIGVGTIVIGDVTAKSATISGAVKGEIDVQGPVIVDSTAIVKGNITAKSIQINNGAVVDGYCKLSYAEVDIDNFFDGE